MGVYIQDRVRLTDREIHNQTCIHLFLSDTYGDEWVLVYMLENATVLPVDSCFGMIPTDYGEEVNYGYHLN